MRDRKTWKTSNCRSRLSGAIYIQRGSRGLLTWIFRISSRRRPTLYTLLRHYANNWKQSEWNSARTLSGKSYRERSDRIYHRFQHVYVQCVLYAVIAAMQMHARQLPTFRCAPTCQQPLYIPTTYNTRWTNENERSLRDQSVAYYANVSLRQRCIECERWKKVTIFAREL